MEGDGKKRVSLDQLYEFSSGLSKPRSAFGSGHPFLTFKDVFYNTFVPRSLGELVTSSEGERTRLSIKRGDVFLTRTSETMDELGMSCVALIDIPDATFNGFTKRLRPKSQKAVVPEYAGYFFRGPQFRSDVTAMSSMSTRASLNNEMLARLSIDLPPANEQLAIGNILKTLDDKIELNQRMSETLEVMAWALFKSWFVDFDPVRAKSEGRDPKLPNRVADLFADSFQSSELGKIPSGWQCVPLGDLIELAYGKALKEEARRSGAIPVFGSNGRVGFHDEKLAEGPGIIVGRKGNPGTVTWSPTDFFAIDTTFYVLPKGRNPSFCFLYHALTNQDLSLQGADSAVPGLNRNMAYLSKQVVPPAHLLDAFDEQVRPLFKNRHERDEESNTLAALRDALLPKLISGEIRIADPVAFLARLR